MSLKFTKRLRKNNLVILGFILVFGLFFTAIFGYTFAPDNSQDSNKQSVLIKLKNPGFSCSFYTPDPSELPNNLLISSLFGKENTSIQIPIKDSFYLKNDIFYYQNINQNMWIEVPFKGSLENIVSDRISSKTFYLGTDGLGRDVLSRLIIGARVSMLVGLVAVMISLFIGTLLGLMAGYYGGRMDKIILWLINVFWAIPTVLLAMAMLMAFKGNSKFQILIVFLAVGLTMWVDTARLIRGLVIQIRERQYIEAAKALAFSEFRIIVFHILPNTFSTLIVITASNFATAILMESGLSYLGLGVQPPTPSWGSMLREYYSYLGTNVSYLAIFPGLCIMIAVLSFYIVGNGLRDVGDVKGL